MIFGSPSDVQVQIGDIYADERRRVVFELQIPRLAQLGLAAVAQAVVRYVSVGEQVAAHELTLPVVVKAVSAEEAATVGPDAEVTEEVVILKDVAELCLLGSRLLRPGALASDHPLSGLVPADPPFARARGQTVAGMPSKKARSPTSLERSSIRSATCSRTQVAATGAAASAWAWVSHRVIDRHVPPPVSASP
jgi:hypothetical protein